MNIQLNQNSKENTGKSGVSVNVIFIDSSNSGLPVSGFQPRPLPLPKLAIKDYVCDWSIYLYDLIRFNLT